MNDDANLFGPDITLHRRMYESVAPRIVSGPWHWYYWLFAHGPRRPFVARLITACAECELKLPGLGWSLIEDVASISGREKHEPHYEMLIQKLSEILVLRQLLYLAWPEGTMFHHEPAAIPNGKRPELKVDTPDRIFLFEVKAPSLLSHQRTRSQNPVQFPGRMFDAAMRKMLAGEHKPILPRDNPIKDFLASAEEKFAPFAGEKETVGILIIVWDDFMFEPITSLVHAPSQGLLTTETFARTADGSPVTYPHIDAVVIVRHLLYFQQGAAETLTERKHAFDFGGDRDLPNVLVPVPGGKRLPEVIITGLRALHYDDVAIRNFADYRPQEYVWFNT
jgi:hypothetical protein